MYKVQVFDHPISAILSSSICPQGKLLTSES